MAPEEGRPCPVFPPVRPSTSNTVSTEAASQILFHGEEPAVAAQHQDAPAAGGAPPPGPGPRWCGGLHQHLHQVCLTPHPSLATPPQHGDGPLLLAGGPRGGDSCRRAEGGGIYRQGRGGAQVGGWVWCGMVQYGTPGPS